jgi:hypothetical protein
MYSITGGQAKIIDFHLKSSGLRAGENTMVGNSAFCSLLDTGLQPFKIRECKKPNHLAQGRGTMVLEGQKTVSARGVTQPLQLLSKFGAM